MTEFVTYTAAIAATDNSTAVVGTGTSFIIDGVRPGDIAYFLEASGPVGYPIEVVGSATSLTLSCNYEGSTGSSKSVIIARRYGEEKAADTFRLLNSYVQALEDTISVSQAGIRYVYSSTTTMSAPASGTFRLNNVSAASVTAIAFSDLCGETGNPDASAFINSWDDSSAVTKGILYFKKAGDPATFMVYAITGLTDNTGWSQLAVSYVTGNGSLVDADAIRIDFYRTGNDGFEAGTRLTYSTTTTDSDPGDGTFRFNNVTFASITQIYIDNTDAGGSTITALLDLVDDSTTTAARGIIRLQKTGDPTVYRDFTVNGAVVDGTGYRKIPVTPIQSSGTWTNGNSFSFTFFRTGNAGVDGYAPGFRYSYSNTTTDSDPGAGTLRFNNALAASATQAFIDNVDGAGATVTTWLDGLDDSTQTNHCGYLRIQKVNDPAVYREFVVTGAVVDGTGYRKVPISLVQEAGVLANNDGLVLTFSRTGNAGTNGTDGFQPGYRLTFSTTVTDADPGAGTFRLNNALFASVTQLFIDNLDAAGADITAWLDALDDATSAVKGVLRIEQIGVPTTYREFRVTGTIVDGTGYRKVPVQPVANNGTLANGASVAMTWFRSGDAGSASIANGTYGDIVVTDSGTTWTVGAGAITNTKLADAGLIDLASRWTAASTAGPASLDFLEDTDFGANRVRVQAPSSLASDATVTLPSATGTLATLAGTETLDNKSLSSLNSGALAGFRNHIINGAMMVSQRATSFTSSGSANNDDTYNLDRWILLSDGNDIVDVSQSTEAPTNGLNSIALDVETVNKKFGILQIIEQKNCIGLIGNTVTLSFKAKVSSTTKLDNLKAAIISWSGTADAVTSDIVSAWGAEGTNPTLVANWTYENTPVNLAPTTSWATYTITAAIDTASTKNIAVFIWSDVTDTTLGDFLHITDVQLEIGSTATPFERRSFQTEMGLCERYYQELMWLASAYTSSIMDVYFAANFRVKMFALPTVLETDETLSNGTTPNASIVTTRTLANFVRSTGAVLAYAEFTAKMTAEL
jgi:hypothetical protein